MKTNIFFLFWFVYICFISETFSGMDVDLPLKYISGFELDLTNDNKSDIALLLETSRGYELIVLVNISKGYNTFVISQRKSPMHLSCHFGKTVKETDAGEEKRKGGIYKTNGTYIQLSQPENATVVYFWNGKGFTEVWTSD